MLKGLLFTSLFLAYPYLVYQGMDSGMNWLAPMVIAGFLLQRAWRAATQCNQLLNAGGALLLLVGAFMLQSLTAKSLPVIVQVSLLLLFGRTLLKDQGPPLIDSIVRLQFPESPPSLSQYCRQLTWIWTLFFAFNTLVCVGLAIWGSDYWWALYTGLGIYLLMCCLAVGEYIYRRIHFADLSILHQGIPDPIASIKTLFINGRKVFLAQKER